MVAVSVIYLGLLKDEEIMERNIEGMYDSRNMTIAKRMRLRGDSIYNDCSILFNQIKWYFINFEILSFTFHD